ncbi:MAG TPA: Rid family hydrolase, partial [Burkholderiales bacterium]
PEGWRAPAHMSAGVSAGGLAFFSGVIGTDESGRPVELSESVRAKLNVAVELSKANSYSLQAAAAVSALTRRLASASGSLSNIAHLTVYLDDISHFPAVERALDDAFGAWRPALTVLEVPAPAPVRGARVSLTAIGWLGEEKMSASL